MYLQVLWALVIFAILASAWLGATRAEVTAAARHAAMRAANVALERAQDALVESVAVQAAAGATSFTAPTPSPPESICPTPPPGAPACPFFVATSVALAGQTASGVTPPNQTAYNLQTNARVAEQRLAAVVTATVTARAGPAVGELSRRVTLRTLAAWPFAAVAGTDEPTIDGRSVGDFAGACDGGVCGADSRIHAIEECSDPSQPQNCVGQSPLPVDAFTSRPWRDNNAESSGWSR